MTQLAINPPVPTNATHYRVTMQFLVGGPTSHVREAVLRNGIPAETAAFSTIAPGNGWSPEWGDGLTLVDASDFLDRGALRITSPTFNRDYWYTYEVRLGNVFYGLEPVFQRKSEYTYQQSSPFFPAGAKVSQWAEISKSVKRWSRDQASGEGETYWTMQLDGVKWNSLQLYPGASVLAIETIWDNIIHFHDPHIWFAGTIQSVQPSGNPRRNRWTASAEGIRADLLLQRNSPGQIGGEIATMTWTGSPALEDTSAEPLEGDNPGDFSIGNINNQNLTDLYIARDVPSVSLRNLKPNGIIEPDSRVLPITQKPNSGIGLRFDMLYLNPQNTPRVSAQRQKFLVLYNNHQVDPPDRDNGTTADPKKWGIINVSDYHLMLQNRDGSLCGNTGYFTTVYLGTKNGGSAPTIALKPQCGLVIGYDEPVFRSQWSLPEGWIFLDIRQCSGEMLGKEKNIVQRGVGLRWDPDPLGCVIALRQGGMPNIQDDGRYTAQVVTDTVQEIVLDSSLATWPVKGWVRGENSNQLVYYDGIDYGQNKLFGCVRLRWNGNPIAAGDRLDIQSDVSYWWDLVAVGADSVPIIPTDYPVKRVGEYGSPDDGQTKDQNASTRGEKVWGVWDNGGSTPIYWDPNNNDTLTPFVTPGAWGSFPTDRKHIPACPFLQALRRKATMGGGVFAQRISSPEWSNHDSNSYADWEVYQSPRIGNIDELLSFVYLRGTVAEHTAAVCLADHSDVGTDPDGSIEVKQGQAREYPASVTANQVNVLFMRALLPGGGQVDFQYENRDESHFYGVKKIHATGGIAIPEGATFTKVFNRRSNWNVNGVDSWRQANLPIVTGFSLARWIGSADADVLSTGTDTITVRPGQAAGFPANGTLTLWPPQEEFGGGILVTPATLGPVRADQNQFKATYTARTDSGFSGVTFLGYVPQPGWRVAVNVDFGANFPTDMDILGTREESPVDPLLFIDRNESWDILFKSADGTQRDTNIVTTGERRKFYPNGSLTLPNPYYSEFYIKVHRTSDLARFKANELLGHKLPTRGQSASGDRSNLDDWEATYYTSTFIHDIFLDGGVPAEQMRMSGGSRINRDVISEGSLWRTGVSFAIKGGSILSNTADNLIVTRDDPQTSGAPYNAAPRFVLDAYAVWGDIQATERPRRAVGQVRLEARDALDMTYAVSYPSVANPDGEVLTIQNRLVTSGDGALKLASLLYRQANGGWILEAPTGPFANDLEYGDILRVNVTADEAGRFFSQEFMVIGLHNEGEDDRMRTSVKLREWTTP